MGWTTRAPTARTTPARPTCCARAARPRRSLTLLLDALQGLRRRSRSSALCGARWGLGEGTVALVGAGGVPRPPVAGLLPLPGRQGRGHGGRRAARHRTRGSALATLLTWLIIAAFFRYSSLASIVSAVFAPFYQLLIWGGGPAAVGDHGDGPAAALAARGQHPQAADGTESRIGQKAGGAVPARARRAAPARPATRSRTAVATSTRPGAAPGGQHEQGRGHGDGAKS